MRNRENPFIFFSFFASNKPLKACLACKCKNNAIQPTQHRMFLTATSAAHSFYSIILSVFSVVVEIFILWKWNQSASFFTFIYLFLNIFFISIIFKTITLFKQMYRCFPIQASRLSSMNDAILIPSKNERVYMYEKTKKGQYFFSANISILRRTSSTRVMRMAQPCFSHLVFAHHQTVIYSNWAQNSCVHNMNREKNERFQIPVEKRGKKKRHRTQPNNLKTVYIFAWSELFSAYDGSAWTKYRMPLKIQSFYKHLMDLGMLVCMFDRFFFFSRFAWNEFK